MKLKLFLLVMVLALAFTKANSQTQMQETTYRKFFIGSTLWELGNFIPGDTNPPDLVQLHFGYRITPKNVISIEAKTWKYAWPLGIPYGKSFQAPAEKYPGFVRLIFDS